MHLKRVLVWLIPAYLLAVQQVGIAHELSHTLNPAPSQEHLSKSDVCTTCTSFAKVSFAGTSEPFVTPPSPNNLVRHDEANVHVVDAQRPAPRSRSPPELLPIERS